MKSLIKFNIKLIDSSEYKKNLKDILPKLNLHKHDKEEIVRKNFEDIIKAILVESKIFERKYSDLIGMFTSETKIKKASSREIGFIDSDFKNVVIEYKRYERLDNNTDKSEAINQLKNYLLSPDLDKYPLIYGFLTDGKNIFSYKKENSIVEEIKEFSGYLNEYNLDYLIRCLVNYDKKDITPFSLKEDFAINSNKEDNPAKKLFLELLSIKEKSTYPRTKLLFSEWEKLFKLSEADNNDNNLEVKKRRNSLAELVGRDVRTTSDEYNIIFTLHTVYSLIIKLIAIKAAKENNKMIAFDFMKISTKSNVEILDLLTKIENGNLYKQMNILNMTEGDFFSWYIKENLTNDFYKYFKEISKKLSKYETFSIKKLYKTQDFFRELYESCIPGEIRHSFGEYYTPYWLADGVISDYILSNNITTPYKSLDPTCGSGTFVMVNMDKIIQMINKNNPEATNKQKLEIILENCYGVDLNPLAVLSSKINYFMNIASVYDGVEEIELPIYLGDSSYMPEEISLDGVRCISYDFFTNVNKTTNFIHFCLPLSLIDNKKFISYMDDLEFIIVGKDKDEVKIDKATKYLYERINKSEFNSSVKKEIDSLILNLVELESKKLNSIWLRIFANYLKAASISNVDLVAGNPPWVDWKNLPDKYREKLKNSCKDTGIFSNDKNVGGISLNICALIAMKCIDKYVKNNGELCFLMPKSILFNKSFEGFRNFEINNTRYYFKKITDWSKAGKPFDPVSIEFCSFAFSAEKQDYEKGIPFIEYKSKPKAKLTDTHASFETEITKLDKKELFAIMAKFNSNNPFTILSTPINISSILGKKQYEFRKGLGLKAEVHKLQYSRECKENNKLAYFYTFELPGKYKKITTNEVLLEKQFVRPLVETPSIDFYDFTWDNLYTTFPYYNSKDPISFEELKEKAPYLAKYLQLNRDKLENQSEYNKRVQSTDEFYGIIRTGTYLFRKHFACIKDNGKLVCAPVEKVITHWGEEITPVFDGHISYVSEKNNEGISEDEMYFIVGIMNCPEVKIFIESSSSEQSIGTKFDINLPLYNKDNEIHKKIVSLSKELFKIQKERKEIIKEIEKENEINKHVKQSVINKITEYLTISEIDLKKVTDSYFIELIQKVIRMNLLIKTTNEELQENYFKLK